MTTIAFLQLRMNSSPKNEIFDSTKSLTIPTTLVICPATLMSHWESEINKYSRMRCFIYHGSSRKKDIPTGGAIRAFGQYCVVLTSYELVRAEHSAEEVKVKSLEKKKKKAKRFRLCLIESIVRCQMAKNCSGRSASNSFT